MNYSDVSRGIQHILKEVLGPIPLKVLEERFYSKFHTTFVILDVLHLYLVLILLQISKLLIISLRNRTFLNYFQDLMVK